MAVAALAVRQARRRMAIAFAVAFALVEVVVLPYATVDGDRVIVHNIRNFDYRTESDFTPAYYDRTFEMTM